MTSELQCCWEDRGGQLRCLVGLVAPGAQPATMLIPADAPDEFEGLELVEAL